MNCKRITIPATLAVLLMMSSASVRIPSVAATGAPIITPVSFILTPAQCPNLEVTVEGSGENLLVVNQRIDKEGNVHIVVNSTSNGTAIDSNGVNYVFNYHQHNNITIPPEGFPFELNITDHFNLNGKGKANKLHVGIVARLTFTAPGVFQIDRLLNGRGDIACDPI